MMALLPRLAPWGCGEGNCKQESYAVKKLPDYPNSIPAEGMNDQ